MAWSDWYQRLPFIVFFGALAWRVAVWFMSWIRRPRFRKEDILFQEWFASGSSRKNFLTSMGGASNCVRLVVTADHLWVTLWFPFALLAAPCDLDHLISRASLVSVERKQTRWGGEYFVVVFRLPSGSTRELRLAPKKPAAFAAALGVAG